MIIFMPPTPDLRSLGPAGAAAYLAVMIGGLITLLIMTVLLFLNISLETFDRWTLVAVMVGIAGAVVTFLVILRLIRKHDA